MTGNVKEVKEADLFRIDYFRLLSALKEKVKPSLPSDEKNIHAAEIKEIETIYERNHVAQLNHPAGNQINSVTYRLNREMATGKEIIERMTPEIIIALLQHSENNKVGDALINAFSWGLLAIQRIPARNTQYFGYTLYGQQQENFKSFTPKLLQNIVAAAQQAGLDYTHFMIPPETEEIRTLLEQFILTKRVLDCPQHQDKIKILNEQTRFLFAHVWSSLRRHAEDCRSPSYGNEQEALSAFAESWVGSSGINGVVLNLNLDLFIALLSDNREKFRIQTYSFTSRQLFQAIFNYCDQYSSDNIRVIPVISEQFSIRLEIIRHDLDRWLPQPPKPEAPAGNQTTTPTPVTEFKSVATPSVPVASVTPAFAAIKTSAKENNPSKATHNKIIKYTVGASTATTIGFGIAAAVAGGVGLTILIGLCTSGGVAALLLLAGLAIYAYKHCPGFFSGRRPGGATANTSSQTASVELGTSNSFQRLQQ